MKILIVVAPEKFRDEEFTVPAAALQKAGIGYDVASKRRGACTGMLGTKVNATLAFEDVEPKSYDGILIVGGGGAQLHLWDDELLGEMVKYFHACPCRDPEGEKSNVFQQSGHVPRDESRRCRACG